MLRLPDNHNRTLVRFYADACIECRFFIIAGLEFSFLFFRYAINYQKYTILMIESIGFRAADGTSFASEKNTIQNQVMLYNLRLSCPCQIRSTRSSGRSSLFPGIFDIPVNGNILNGFQPGLSDRSHICKVITGISFFKQGLFGKIIP